MSDPYDVARNIFVNDEHELRSGWRVLLFLICFLIVAGLLAGLSKAFATLFPSLGFIFAPSDTDNAGSSALIRFGVSNVMNLAAAVIACAICARSLERRSLGSIGFRLHRGWSRDFALGSAMGAASLAIAVGIAAGAGALSFDVQGKGWARLVGSLAIGSLFFIIAAATEELLFRGFAFQALVHNLGGAAAVAITSLIFGLAHLSNPGSSTFSTINTILAGIWLGLAYLLTRSLWLATALHWSWNFAMVVVFGLPVSGLTTLGELSWLNGAPRNPTWISGGDYGPEAGVAATVALILSTFAIWKSGLFICSEEMLVAIKHGKPEPAFVSVTPEVLPISNQNDHRQKSD